MVTTSRMPFAVEEIRHLGQNGHTVFAADTYRLAAGSHSKYVEKHFEYPSPRFEKRAFNEAVRSLVEKWQIDLLLPTFEEGFYLSEARAELPSRVRLFAPDLKVLRLLHEKSSFLELARGLQLPVPPTTVVTSIEKMRAEMDSLGDYFARPVSARGGMEMLTNRGILRGRVLPDECDVSEDRPWIIQPFVEGPELCSYSVAYRGKILVHVTYRHPILLGDRGGITFEAIDSKETLPMASAIASATELTGQFGLDFIETSSGLYLGECNPRGTAGVSLIPSEVFAAAVTTPEQAEPYVCPAGRRRKIASGLLLDSLQHFRHLPQNLRALLHSGEDVYGPPGDLAPAFYSLLSFTHLARFQRLMPSEAHHDLDDMVRSQFFDVIWEPVKQS